MTFLPLLAQQAADASQASWWDALVVPPTKIYGQVVHYPPIVAIPVFLAILAGISIVVERVSAFVVTRFTKRTVTRVDDVLVAGIPTIVRTMLLFGAIRVTTLALIHGEEASAAAGRWIRATAIVCLGIVVTGISLRMTDAWVEGRPQMKPVGPGIKLALKIAVIPVLLVTVLQVFGIEISAFLTVLGVGSLAVALALQDPLKNVFSGIQIVLDQPIRAGDFISIDDGKQRGTVLEVGLRSTKIRTVENNVLIVPNATLANAVITNMDVADPVLVQAVNVGVSYDSDARAVERVLVEVAQQVIDRHEQFVKEAPRVVFREFGDSALLFSVFVKVRRFSERLEAAGELHHCILERFRKERIEIAFPTRTLWIRQEAPNVPPPVASGPGSPLPETPAGR